MAKSQPRRMYGKKDYKDASQRASPDVTLVHTAVARMHLLQCETPRSSAELDNMLARIFSWKGRSVQGGAKNTAASTMQPCCPPSVATV